MKCSEIKNKTNTIVFRGICMHKKVYSQIEKNYTFIKSKLNKPLTLSEKILYSHLDINENSNLNN